MSKEVKDLAIVNGGFMVPQMDSNLGMAMAEEMDGLTISFDKVKIPSGGGVAFEVPGDDPESPDMVKELIGVIVDHHPINGYWGQKFDGQNNAPDCSSMDGKVGIGNPGGNCKTCPCNQFGSAPDGKGKLCKNMHRVYILRSGEMLPLLLTLPPTSIKTFSDYIAKRIVMKGLRSYGVVTKVTLKKAQNAGGITYSQAQFSVEAVLDKETTEKMRQFSESIKATTRQLSVADESDTVAVENSNDDIPF